MKAILAFVILCALPVSARTQEGQFADRSGPTVRSQDWALLFQIDRRFMLRSFEGLLVAIERSLNPVSGLRLGLQVGGGTLDRDWRREIEFADRGDVRTQDREDEEVSAMLALLYVRTPNPGRKFHVYWACGPQVGLSRIDQEASTSVAPEQWSARSTIRRTTWSVGIGAALGVRWFPTRSFGLLAEYKASASAFFRSGTVSNGSTRSPSWRVEIDDRGFLLNRSSPNFGLVARF